MYSLLYKKAPEKIDLSQGKVVAKLRLAALSHSAGRPALPPPAQRGSPSPPLPQAGLQFLARLKLSSVHSEPHSVHSEPYACICSRTPSASTQCYHSCTTRSCPEQQLSRAGRALAGSRLWKERSWVTRNDKVSPCTLLAAPKQGGATLYKASRRPPRGPVTSVSIPDEDSQTSGCPGAVRAAGHTST